MANEIVTKYYRSWIHEKRRGTQFGRSGYAINCDIEIQRLEAEHPELKDSFVCTCPFKSEAEITVCY